VPGSRPTASGTSRLRRATRSCRDILRSNTLRDRHDSGTFPSPDFKLRHRHVWVSTFMFTTLPGGASPREPHINPSVPTSHLHPSQAQHYTLFPPTLGQMLREYSVTDLHLSPNAGRWNYDSWRYPDHPSVGTGAELWAWMADGEPLS